MPTIRIDDDVWKALQEGAKPFVDTPNDVLRRVFRLDPVTTSSSIATSKRRSNMRRIGATPQGEYRLPIVESLLELHGSAMADEVLQGVFRKVKSKLKPIDQELMENGGEPRWRLQARFERKNMVLDGLLKSDSQHGLWELTDKGRRNHE